MIPVFVNGEEQHIPSDASVSSLLELLELPQDRIAVELNKAIVRKRDWKQTAIPPGAQVEIVHFVGGG